MEPAPPLLVTSPVRKKAITEWRRGALESRSGSLLRKRRAEHRDGGLYVK